MDTTKAVLRDARERAACEQRAAAYCRRLAVAAYDDPRETKTWQDEQRRWHIRYAQSHLREASLLHSLVRLSGGYLPG
jgi:hypothetical protein